MRKFTPLQPAHPSLQSGKEEKIHGAYWSPRPKGRVVTGFAFKPKPGQIDFTHARFAPVINCVLAYRGKILVVRRSRPLNLYPGYWNGISGFLDDARSLGEKVRDELREEVGIYSKDIISIRLGQIFLQEAPKYKKTWIVHPVLVRVRTTRVKLDWEASAYRWVSPREVQRMKLLPGFARVLTTFFNS